MTATPTPLRERHAQIAAMPLEQTCGGRMSHDEVASKVRMLMRSDLDHEAVCTIARDRIAWLAGRVAELEAALSARDAAGAVDPERVAQLIAHRACCGVEHDPASGKLHGYCVVCGVPWPCEYAGKPPVATPPAASGDDECVLVSMDDRRMAHLDFCRETDLLDRVREAVFAFGPEGITADQWQELREIRDALLEEGTFDFEGDPPLYLFKLAKPRRLAAVAPDDAAFKARMFDALTEDAKRRGYNGLLDVFGALDIAAVAPAGMVLVPREPTPEMLAATKQHGPLNSEWSLGLVGYQQMIAAAPTPPGTAGEE